MRGQRVVLTAALVVAGAALCSAQAPSVPSIAVVDFDTTPGGTTLPPPHLGDTAAELTIDRLVASGQFHVFDGRWLVGGTDRRPSSERWRRLTDDAHAGGLDYVLLGSVTRFSTESRRRTLGGAAFILPLLAGAGRETTELVMGVLIRVVDTTTGEVVTTATGQGKASRTSIGGGGAGLLRAGGAATFSNAASQFRDALLGEAAERSVAQAVQSVVKAAPRLPPQATATSEARSPIAAR